MRLRDTASHFAHLLAEALLGLVALGGVAACLLAWRLAQGPVDLTWLVRREESLLAGPGASLAVGAAELAWEGFDRANQPLDLRVREVVVTAPDGSVLAHVEQARVSLALAPLLRGAVVPRGIDIEAARVDLRRQADGTVRLDFGVAASTERPAGAGGVEILRELSRPARATDSLPWLSQLRHLAVHNSTVTLRDAALGLVWQAPRAEIDLERQPGGGVTGQARLDLAVQNLHLGLTASAEMHADGSHLLVRATPISPASLAGLAPGLAPLAALDAPVTAALDASLDEGFALKTSRLTLGVDAGTVHAGTGTVGLTGASASLAASDAGLALDDVRIALAPLPGGHGPPPVITAHAAITDAGGGKQVAFGIGIASLDLADLARYWPPGTGGGSRGWLVQNIAGGQARDAQVAGTLQVPVDLSDVSVTALSGGMAADGLTLFWLKPVPPITQGRARLVIDGPDVLRIMVDDGQQNRLRITKGLVRINGLAGRHQFGDIAIAMQGPLQDALEILNHPRLKLLSRRKLELRDPAGTVQADLAVRLPLEAAVDMDGIAISAKAALADVHLGGIAAGRDLDRGKLALTVDSDALAMHGTGAFAGIDANLAVDMDFRVGPPSQVLEHMAADGHADQAQLIAAGVPRGVAAALVSNGSAALSIDRTTRRDTAGTLRIGVDLSQAAVNTPLGWSKKIGDPAALAASLALRDGKLQALDRLDAHGPGLLVQSHADLAAGQTRLSLDRLELGRTRAHGDIAFPRAEGGPIRVTLAGATLDLSSYLSDRATPPGPKDQAPEAEDAPPERGPAWSADLRFDEVLLADQLRLAPLSLRAENDGLRTVSGTVQAGPSGTLAATIAPGRGGRVLSIDAKDAGAALRALDVADNIRGGRLKLDASFADAEPHTPLRGTATLSEFSLTDAPAIGRLLQAMTLYGLTDVLRGPGLRFSKMVAPFMWQSRVLHLENARAFSPSLGLTAQGDIDLRRHVADIRGTIVPAYFFNQLLGKIPLVGGIFSPEKGGGVFAARYSVSGKLADPKVGVNALSALTPGFLRGVFGAF